MLYMICYQHTLHRLYGATAGMQRWPTIPPMDVMPQHKVPCVPEGHRCNHRLLPIQRLIVTVPRDVIFTAAVVVEQAAVEGAACQLLHC
jgi:hypothetical protein